MLDEIQRKFKVQRGAYTKTYPFTTFSCVFQPQKDLIKQKLFAYLAKVFTEGCPTVEGKISVSEANPIIVKVEERESELTELAKAADYRNRGQWQHDIVQRHFMEHDKYTIAIEVPVWDETHKGHIDILRIFPDKLQVTDVKPEAHKEKKAGAQVKRYMLLLSKAIGLPLRYFEGVYFDDSHAYFIS